MNNSSTTTSIRYNTHSTGNPNPEETLAKEEEEQAEERDKDLNEYHTIIKDEEKATGDADKHEFQAETRMLLDIVAKSLYSESEIFVRELISNASDALEKLRFLSLAGAELESTGLQEIHLRTDKQQRTFIIQDTGVGMTKDEMIENLGTIAKSGSKAFLEKIKELKLLFI